jgi:hypothetical protein
VALEGYPASAKSRRFLQAVLVKKKGEACSDFLEPYKNVRWNICIINLLTRMGGFFILLMCH